MNKERQFWGERLFRLLFATFFILVLLAACSTPETIEVTRVVTETEIIEVPSEAVEVEVTRVVTETVTETVVEEFEAEEGEEAAAEEPEPPAATGSEDDSGPLPPAPDDGPKVTARTGAAASDGSTAEVGVDTAVPRRVNPVEITSSSQPALASATNLDTVGRQQWCKLAQALHKKRCS